MDTDSEALTPRLGVTIVTPTSSDTTTSGGGGIISASSKSRSVTQPSTGEPFSWKGALSKRLPILKWLPKYKKADIVPDTISGITVGLTAIPQSMAYANIAGLTPEYGLYSSFVSCFVYLFLGSCRQMTIGPTALMELLVFETCGQDFSSCVILIGFWVGVIQFIMGLLKLGAIVSLISDPVTIGFVGGASLTICSSQIRTFFGLSGPKGDSFVGYVRSAIENITTAKWGDSVLGLCCAITLILFKNLKDYIKPSTESRSGLFISKFLWVLSISRNALVVIVASAVAAILTDPPFALTGAVKSGLPPVGPPEFELPAFPSKHNETHSLPSNGTLSFWDTWGELTTAPLMIAIVSILQNVAIAKAFGSGQSIDATQEMIALGVSHIVASFFSAIPTAGSFTRSAVNEASGVRSPLGGIFTGMIVLFALSFLTRWFSYIPKATLAAVILCAVLPMIEYETILPMWKVSKLDVLTCLITFLASLFLGMEYGIIIGVAASLALYLVRPVRPRVKWSIVHIGEEHHPSKDFPEREGSPTPLTPMLRAYHLLKPEQGFNFPSVDAVRTLVNKIALKHPEIKVIALDCESMLSMDYTSAGALASLVAALKKTSKLLVFIHCEQEWVDMMKTVGLKSPQCFEDLEGLENFICEVGSVP